MSSSGRLYDAQVFCKSRSRECFVVDYAARKAVSVYARRRRENLYEAWRSEDREHKIYGSSLKDCIEKMFGYVNLAEDGSIIPITPCMCVKGKDIFSISSFENGIIIENIAFRDVGVSSSYVCLNMNYWHQSERTSYYAYKKTRDYYEVYVLNAEKQMQGYLDYICLRWNRVSGRVFEIHGYPKRKVELKVYTLGGLLLNYGIN